MSFARQDPTRNEFMLTGSFAKEGYDWWWHSFTAVNEETGEEKPFFIDFFLCNPALGGDEPVLGQLPENKANGVKPSYLMVKAGCWGEGKCQLHRFFGWNSVTVREGAPYSVAAADCYASDTELRGSVSVSPEDAAAHPEWMCDGGEISWELTIDKKIAYNVGYGASAPFRTAKAFEMYWHAEGMKSLYSGTVVCNGVRYVVEPERCYGYADKNWGRGFTSPWVWLSSWDLTSKTTGERLENSVFDIGGGRPKIYDLPLERKLLGGFWYEGTPYEFNFSKSWTAPRTEFSAEETEDEILWHVRQENLHTVMVTEIRCKKKDMILVNYEAPDGSKRHNRLWNGGNGTGTISLYRKERGELVPIDEVIAGHIGCEYGEYDRDPPGAETVHDAPVTTAGEALRRLKEGNARYLDAATGSGDVSPEIRAHTCEHGQKPYAVVVTCSDSRVIPESIFDAGIGELFVIRVAGNVIDRHQLGSIEYAVEHLNTPLIVVLGHDHCGAVHAAIHHSPDGHIKYITDEILRAIGSETDDYKASCLNVKHSVEIIEGELEIQELEHDRGLRVVPALYRIATGEVEFL